MFSTLTFLIGGGMLGWIFYELQEKDHIFSSFKARKHHKKGGGGEEGEEYGGGGGGGKHHKHGYSEGPGTPSNPHNKGGLHYRGTRGYYTKKGHHHCTKGEKGCICTDPSKCHVIHHSNLGIIPGHHHGGHHLHLKHHKRHPFLPIGAPMYPEVIEPEVYPAPYYPQPVYPYVYPYPRYHPHFRAPVRRFPGRRR